MSEVVEPAKKKQKMVQLSLSSLFQGSKQIVAVISPEKATLSTPSKNLVGRRPTAREMAEKDAAEWKLKYEQLVAVAASQDCSPVDEVKMLRISPGRPFSTPEQRRGIAGGLRSNKRLKAQKAVRKDLPAATKLSIAKQVAEKLKEEPEISACCLSLSKTLGHPSQLIRGVYEKLSVWGAIVEKERLKPEWSITLMLQTLDYLASQCF